MLNNFCFHVYAQKSLFMAENCNVFFLTATTSCEFGVSRAGSQLKIGILFLIKIVLKSHIFLVVNVDKLSDEEL